jgi:NTP pyrophosphatase (non-canonical NTP hydrolase)
MNDLIFKVRQWAFDRNIINGSDFYRQYMKAQSEMGELADALLKGQMEETRDAIGDVLVCLINLTEQCGLSLTECLEAAYEEIKDRKGIMWQGVFVKETDPEYQKILEKLNG